METPEGLSVIRGTIATFAGDNLGSQLMGGFKEGGTALRPCRVCMATSHDIREKVNHNLIRTHVKIHVLHAIQLQEKEFDMRNVVQHNHICSLLDSLESHEYHTTTYGVNRQSPLNSLSYFHVCDYGLPPDIMHDLLEGYVPYSLKLMLTEFITLRKYFKLADLNETIIQFKYESTKSKPRLLSMSALSIDESKTCLKMSGM